MLTLTQKTLLTLFVIILISLNHVFTQTSSTLIITSPKDITVLCNAIPSIKQPLASTTCKNKAIVITVKEVKTIGPCPDSYLITRTWTATDACGKIASAVQKITVNDKTPPSIGSIPANTTVSCDKIPIAIKPSATDICDTNVDIVASDKITKGLCPDSYRITREWIATDNCNNKSTKTQIISVIDAVKPVLAALPPNITVDCNQIPTKAILTATDNCDISVDIIYTETKTSGICPENYSLKREWTASDNCGNTARYTQKITVQDKKAPIFSSTPASLTIDCAQISPVPNISANDNCDTKVDIVYKEIKSNLAPESGVVGCRYNLTRTWTATDNCANTAFVSQNIIVQDNKAPKFTSSISDITVNSCNQIPDKTTPPSAIDNCDKELIYTIKETKINGICTDKYVLKREWTVTDKCGNSASTTQLISVFDVTAPAVLGVPANVQMSCSQAIPAVGTSVYGTDDCDKQLDITFKTSKIDGTCPENYTLKREWTATDNCGNKTTKTQTIIVKDIYTPYFTTLLQDITVECDKIPFVNNVKAVDNCDKLVDITINEIKTAGACPGSYSLRRTWTAVDNCSNSKTISQTITVKDKTAPKFTGVPAEISVECDAIPTAVAVAKDNCDANAQIKLETKTFAGSCVASYSIERVWTATDNCSNSSTMKQKIIVKDTKAPELNNGVAAPSDITVNCNQIPSPAKLSFKDNCDISVTVTYSQDIVTTNSGCAKKVVRTWIANDDCFNSTVISQSIYLIDNQAPTLGNIPVNVTVDCDKIPEASKLVTVTDNCSALNPITVNDNSVTEKCKKTITRVWTATDACGNSSTASQIITVLDLTPPEAINPPNLTINLACGAAIPDPAAVMFKDKCNDDVTVSFAEERIETSIPTCPISKIIRRWIAKDACGNTTQLVQIINFGVTNNKQAAVKQQVVPLDNDKPIMIENQSSVYPNPTDGIVTATFSKKADEVKIVDEYGRVIFYQNSISENQLKIDLSNEQNGIYLLQFQKGNKIESHKIILIKH